MDKDPTSSTEPVEPADEESEQLIDQLRFTPEQQSRINLMRQIAQQITHDTGDAFVLKGGTALLLAYGLPRYSTDLDFDGKRPSTDITRSIEAALPASGIEGSNLNLRKNTDTTRRYVLHYSGSEFDPLKIEVSYRQADSIDEEDVTLVDGLRVYTIEKLAELKAAAFIGRSNARDIYDVTFLLTHHADAVADDTLQAIATKIAELGADQLIAIMSGDDVISNYDITQTTLELIDIVPELLRQRGLGEDNL